MKREMQNKMKKGQVTIFIILALAIVIVLVLLFLNRGNLTSILGGESPVNQIQNCIRESAQEAINVLSVQGGSLEPENYYLYEGNKVDYLCYTSGYYEQCVTQKPLLKQSIEKELEEYINPRAKSCINAVKDSLENKGYSVSMKTPVTTVDIVPNNILIDSELDLKITKDGTEAYKSIKTDLNSKLYNLIMIASSIINFETRYGDAETTSYMIYYQNLKVEKKKQSEGTTIYTLTQKDTNEKFMFASRSVAIPAGVTGQ